MFSNTRGVSPLIATILLIAFAVALGSVIIQWSLNFDNTGCGPVRVEFKPQGDADICYGGAGETGHIKFNMLNKGSSEVIGLTVRMVGVRGVQTHDVNGVQFSQGGAYTHDTTDVVYDFATNGKLSSVIFTPHIRLEGRIEVCEAKKITAESDRIRLCS